MSTTSQTTTTTTFFDGHPFAFSVFREVRATLEEIGEAEIHVTKSEVAFRRNRSFAFVSMPGKWLEHPDAEVVLSIALDREVESSRFKEVVHPSTGVWMHHLEIRSLDDIDDEVAHWLADAWTWAGGKETHT